MRKIYLFFLALMCMMGATSAYAQKTELKLSSTTATPSGVNAHIGNDISEAQVKTSFTGESPLLATTGMVWGTQDGADNTGDFNDASETGFSFKGRPRRGGEFAVQMYDINSDVRLLNLSFKLGDDTSLAFYIYKISGTDVTLLTSKNSGWTLGRVNSFFIESTVPQLVSGDKLLLVWVNKAEGGQKETISDFKGALYENVTKKDVTVKAFEGDATDPSFSATISLPAVENYYINSFLPENGLVDYTETLVTVDDATTEISVKYTTVIPFATTYEGLGGDDAGYSKWLSFFTKLGRMYVRDENCRHGGTTTGTKKYPAIDKATFANLSDRKFWGFICENPLESSVVKIMNKDAGTDKYLYLTSSTSEDNIPLLLATEADATEAGYNTCGWIVERVGTENGVLYYSIKADKKSGAGEGSNQYINNHGGFGFMTTYTSGTDDGSQIKFTGELETYNLLKDRALDAPANATHSLTTEARALITGSTVKDYKAAIAAIQALDNDGVIPFVENGYYYLRNYTPASGTTYVLDSKDGAKATTTTVDGSLIDDQTGVMTYNNINAIWKITTDSNNPAFEPGSEDIGTSKTVGRFITHANSSNRLKAVNNRQLDATGATYYFINLGAGQHFLKNTQYNGTGQQAMAATLGCADDGTLSSKVLPQYKNTRDAWYGIQVTTIDVTIGATGYATIYLPFGVTVPKDSELKVYAVTDAADGVATLTEVTSVPAKQGVILQGAANTAYTLNIDDAAEWTIENNKLSGSCMTSYVEGEAYVLATTTENGVGLYKTELNKNADGTDNEINGTHFQNNANKAYLKLAAGESARFLSFDFGTETGLDVIKVAESASKGAAVYDLSGRRVQNAQKGLYIVNGKKVVK